jgi:hypothetical protein
MGCLRNLGCLLLLAVLAVAVWLYGPRYWPRLREIRGGRPAATAPAVVWEPLTKEGAERARAAVARLAQRSGPVFANLRPGDVSAYVFEELSKGVTPSAENAEAAVIGDTLFVRASVKLSDFGGKETLGPLARMLGERERVQFGGTLDVVRQGLAEYRVKALKVRDLSIPPPMIPRLVRNIERGPRPEGLAPDGLPLVVPPYLADIRIAKGKVTVYKAVP